MKQKIATERIKGRAFEIFLDTQTGMFMCLDDDEWQQAQTLKQLRELLQKIARAATSNISIPLITGERSSRGEMGSKDIEHVEAIGIHGGSGNAMIRKADKRVEQVVSYLGAVFFLPEDEGRYGQLLDASKKSAEELDQFVRNHEVNIGGIVREEIAKLAAKKKVKA